MIQERIIKFESYESNVFKLLAPILGLTESELSETAKVTKELKKVKRLLLGSIKVGRCFNESMACSLSI